MLSIICTAMGSANGSIRRSERPASCTTSYQTAGRPEQIEAPRLSSVASSRSDALPGAGFRFCCGEGPLLLNQLHQGQQDERGWLGHKMECRKTMP